MNTNNNSFVIDYHSFVDLITNSSTESFINITGKTLKCIKDIGNAFLKLAGSDKEFSNYFDVDIAYYLEYSGDNWDEYEDILKRLKMNKLEYFTKAQLAEITKEVEAFKAIEGNEESFDDFSEEEAYDNSEGLGQSQIVVSIKNGLNEDELKLAKDIKKCFESFVKTLDVESSANY